MICYTQSDGDGIAHAEPEVATAKRERPRYRQKEVPENPTWALSTV
jgi:hypothetical protein